MRTRKLKDAFRYVDRLAHYLAGRGWEGANELTTILESANQKIKEIEQKAIADIFAQLEAYSGEARQWAEDDMHDRSEEHIKTTKVEQRKAMMEYKRIGRTIEKLKNL